MDSFISMPDISPLMPEIVLACSALLILLLDLIVKRKATLASLSIVISAVVLYMLTRASGPAFGGMFVADGYAMFFKAVFFVSLILTVLVSVRYIEIINVNFGEYYALMLFATLGMMFMASAGDLIMLYLGLELMALSTYVLAGFIRYERRSNEAAVKYFLLGAFASAFLLFGIALTYGTTGTTNIAGVAAYISEHGLSGNKVLMMAVIFYTVAFGFKIAAAPFHMWAPDAYEGAPTSITAFMSVGPKAAGFAAMGRVFIVMLASMKISWVSIFIPLAIITMAVGNIVALAQTNIKRMLAYSSIAHAGYAMIGIIAGGDEGISSVMNYMLIYAFMNIGAFAIVILLAREGFRGENLSDYEGLAKNHPLASALMLVFMVSLTGIPPTAGFFGKFYVFRAAVHAGYIWLVVTAVVFSVISAYFYLRVVMYMYMKEPAGEKLELAVSNGLLLALLLTTAAVLVIGVLPGRVLDLARMAVTGFM